MIEMACGFRAAFAVRARPDFTPAKTHFLSSKVL